MSAADLGKRLRANTEPPGVAGERCGDDDSAGSGGACEVLPESGAQPSLSADAAGEKTSAAAIPAPEELAVLSPMERLAFRFVHRMNQGRWKRIWTWCQRVLGSLWIHICTYNLVRVYGLDNLNRISHERPIVLVANHRSFFDMYVVSTVLFRRVAWSKSLFFPVRGRFFYESPIGLLINLLMGWWSMYPPFFAMPEKRQFDRYSLRLLADICTSGEGHVIGFHPEGTRNLDPDPYTFLRPQPGIGMLIKAANPQVVPVFIAGLGNNLPKQILGNWTGGEKVRVHFGEMLDLSEFAAKPERARTYKEIGDFVMARIAELGEEDRGRSEEGMRDEG